MRRATPMTLALLVALATTVPAAAKGILALTACGPAACARVDDRRALGAFDGGAAARPPARAERFHVIRVTVGDDRGRPRPAS